MLRRLGLLALALTLVLVALGATTSAEEVEDPTGTACVNATGNATCGEAAVSGTGNATADGTVAAAAVSGTGDADSALVAASGTGNASHGIAVAIAGDADGCIAVSLTGTAEASCGLYGPLEASLCEGVREAADSEAACHDVDPKPPSP